MISENLSTLRKFHGLTQEQVAEKVGVSRQAVAKWENGDSIPDVINCVALAKLYNVTLDDLVNYEESQNLLPIGPKGKYIFGTVTIGDKGQIVIPVKARKVFGLQPGDDLVMLGDIEQGLALIRAQSLVETLEKAESKS